MQKQKPLATGLSLLFLLLLLTCLVFRFWANDRAWQETGPTHITADAGQVFLYAASDESKLSPLLTRSSSSQVPHSCGFVPVAARQSANSCTGWSLIRHWNAL